MTEIVRQQQGAFIEIAENLLNELKNINKRQEDTDKRISALENNAEISTTQRFIIKDKVRNLVNSTLGKNKSRSQIGVAYSTVYRSMRLYGLASPIGFTQKRDFERIVEALDNYKLDIDYINQRVEEIKRNNQE